MRLHQIPDDENHSDIALAPDGQQQEDVSNYNVVKIN